MTLIDIFYMIPIVVLVLFILVSFFTLLYSMWRDEEKVLAISLVAFVVLSIWASIGADYFTNKSYALSDQRDGPSAQESDGGDSVSEIISLPEHQISTGECK